MGDTNEGGGVADDVGGSAAGRCDGSAWVSCDRWGQGGVGIGGGPAGLMDTSVRMDTPVVR